MKSKSNRIFILLHQLSTSGCSNHKLNVYNANQRYFLLASSHVINWKRLHRSAWPHAHKLACFDRITLPRASVPCPCYSILQCNISLHWTFVCMFTDQPLIYLEYKFRRLIYIDIECIWWLCTFSLPNLLGVDQ